MKTMFVLLVLAIISTNSFCQHAVLENDTISYMNSKFYVGDTIHLGYGSDSKKDFVFVFIGSGMTGVTPLEAGFAKGDVKIDKVYKASGTACARGIMLDAPGLRALGGNKIFIQVEGAIDNKEMLSD